MKDPMLSESSRALLTRPTRTATRSTPVSTSSPPTGKFVILVAQRLVSAWKDAKVDSWPIKPSNVSRSGQVISTFILFSGSRGTPGSFPFGGTFHRFHDRSGSYSVTFADVTFFAFSTLALLVCDFRDHGLLPVIIAGLEDADIFKCSARILEPDSLGIGRVFTRPDFKPAHGLRRDRPASDAGHLPADHGICEVERLGSVHGLVNREAVDDGRHVLHDFDLADGRGLLAAEEEMEGPDSEGSVGPDSGAVVVHQLEEPSEDLIGDDIVREIAVDVAGDLGLVAFLLGCRGIRLYGILVLLL